MRRRTALALGAAAGVATAVYLSTRRTTRPRPDPAAPGTDLDVTHHRVPTRDGGELHATVRRPPGTAPTAAVLLAHGWVMGCDFWAEEARRLAADGCLAVTWDQRGHGDSVAGRDGHTIEALADDVGAVLDELVPVDLPVLAVGHSLGAMGVLAWAGPNAAAVRHDVRGVVLANTAFEEFLSDTITGVIRTSDPRVHAIAMRLLELPVPIPSSSLTRAVVKWLSHADDAPAEAVALSLALARSCTPRSRAAFLTGFTTLDLHDAVAALTLPTVVIVSGRDRITPPEHGHRLAEMLPAGRPYVDEQAGHQFPLEQPERMHEIVMELLAAVTEPATATRPA